MKIPFNRPFQTGKELAYIQEAIDSGMLSGNGPFSKSCQSFLEMRFGFNKTLLTTSCTDALEMAGLLLNIEEGDEVIVPSYTFVSTANAFALRGAKIIFADSRDDHPGLDESLLSELIGPRTKAIVPVHYAGVACDMDKISALASDRGIHVIEDAAQAIDASYKSRALGGFGSLASFSFHETKNISCGEGGALIINDPQLADRAEIIWEKGTNRAAFWRGEVNKYGWVDIGSSFLASDLSSAYLLAQMEHIEFIQSARKKIWERYNQAFSELERDGKVKRPFIPSYADNNAHMFYLLMSSLDERSRLINYLKDSGIGAVFHYLPLHSSPFGSKFGQADMRFPNANRYADTLLRLPLYPSLSEKEQDFVITKILSFFS